MPLLKKDLHAADISCCARLRAFIPAALVQFARNSLEDTKHLASSFLEKLTHYTNDHQKKRNPQECATTCPCCLIVLKWKCLPSLLASSIGAHSQGSYLTAPIND